MAHLIKLMPTIVPVVEGYGEVDAVPLLVRRLLSEFYQCHDLDVAKAISARGKGRLNTKLENFLQYASLKPDCVAILVLRDADNECPKEVAKEYAIRARQLRIKVPIAIVIAKKEYEAWFLASLQTVRGKCNIKESAALKGLAEDVMRPKEWLTRKMPPGRAYKETLHQARLTGAIDLSIACASSRSFRRMCHAVEELIGFITNSRSTVTP